MFFHIFIFHADFTIFQPQFFLNFFSHTFYHFSAVFLPVFSKLTDTNGRSFQLQFHWYHCVLIKCVGCQGFSSYLCLLFMLDRFLLCSYCSISSQREFTEYYACLETISTFRCFFAFFSFSFP